MIKFLFKVIKLNGYVESVYSGRLLSDRIQSIALTSGGCAELLNGASVSRWWVIDSGTYVRVSGFCCSLSFNYRVQHSLFHHKPYLKRNFKWTYFLKTTSGIRLQTGQLYRISIAFVWHFIIIGFVCTRCVVRLPSWPTCSLNIITKTTLFSLTF